MSAAPLTTTQRDRKRVCFVVSSPMTAEAFLTDVIRALAARYEVDLVVNADTAAVRHADLRKATLHRVNIVRAISPLADLGALIQLVRLFRRGRYSAVHSLTPKAGLLTAIAACIARIPVRMHTYTGQVWATRRGAVRWLLKAMDTLIARLNTHVLADSGSQLDFLRQARVLAPSQGEVIGQGSVCGVDPGRFKPDAAARTATRAALGIADSSLVFVFVGRLTRDKGVLELAEAFEKVAAARSDCFLLLVGPDEEGLGPTLRRLCPSSGPRLRLVGWNESPERYMAAGDVFCLPSHREGFGAVIIEAAAAGLPAIGSRIYGVVDAVEDGRTGLLFTPGNVSELAAAMQKMVDDAALRTMLGNAARARALRDFSKESLTGALVAFYERALSGTGEPAKHERLRSRFD